MDTKATLKQVDQLLREGLVDETLDLLIKAAGECHLLATDGAEWRECTHQGKNYLLGRKGNKRCRPINTTIWDPRKTTPSSFLDEQGNLNIERVNSAIYSITTAIALYIDTTKPDARKTPGTYFERVLRTLIYKVLGSQYEYGSFVDTSAGIKLSTDISVNHKNVPGSGLILAAKITTRERISQVFTQQRILDVLEPGKYTSNLVALSEMQRDGEVSAHEVCTPDQWLLYQMCLSENVKNAFYADIPAGLSRVTRGGIKLGDLNDFAKFLDAFKQQYQAV